MEKTKQFLREHKMLVAASSAVILIAIIIVVMVLMSKPEAPVSTEDSVTNVSTELTDSSSKADENYLNDINKAPENTEDSTTTVDKDSANEFTDGSESTVEDSDKDTSTTEEPNEDTKNNNEKTENEDNKDNNKNESTENKDKNENNNSESTEVKEPEGNTSSESSTTVVPPVEEEPVTPPPATTVPSVSWTGSGVTLGSLGITIPTLKDFNDEALTDNTNNTFWTGDSSDTTTVSTLYSTLDSIAYKLIDVNVLNAKTGQGFAAEMYSVSFDWASYSSSHDYQLKRDPNSKVYTLIINCPLDSYVTSMGIDVTSYNRDIVLSLCSIFSSQPQTVYNQLYEDIYGDICISDTGWTTVGDCKMHFDYDSSYSGHFVYKIKAN